MTMKEHRTKILGIAVALRRYLLDLAKRLRVGGVRGGSYDPAWEKTLEDPGVARRIREFRAKACEGLRASGATYVSRDELGALIDDLWPGRLSPEEPGAVDPVAP